MEYERLNGTNIDDRRARWHVRNSITSQIEHGDDVRFECVQDTVMIHFFDRIILEKSSGTIESDGFESRAYQVLSLICSIVDQNVDALEPSNCFIDDSLALCLFADITRLRGKGLCWKMP